MNIYTEIYINEHIYRDVYKETYIKERQHHTKRCYEIEASRENHRFVQSYQRNDPGVITPDENVGVSVSDQIVPDPHQAHGRPIPLLGIAGRVAPVRPAAPHSFAGSAARGGRAVRRVVISCLSQGGRI